jgi:hypothetical protein
LSWPVLTAEVTPKPSTSSGMFAIDALVQPLGHLGLGREPGPAGLNVLGDVHCLTTWSKLGVSFTALSGNPSRRLRPRFRPFHTSYATNLPFTGVTGGKTWVVWECVGAAARRPRRPGTFARPSPLLLEKGQMRGLRLLDHDQPRLWERDGYHDRRDPCHEQRYPGRLRRGRCGR